MTAKYRKPVVCLGLTLLLGVTSCQEEWLEPKPLSFFAPENTYNQASGLWGALVACERNMRHELTGDGPPILTEHIFSEVAVEGTTDKSGPAQDLNLMITPDAQLNHVDYNRIGWYWYEGFKGIKYANVVVSRIDDPQDYQSIEERNHILGTAYFHRALRYYRLTHQFGDVPLILDEIIEPKLDFYSTDREVILRKMKEDLEFAEQWVPEVIDRGRVPKGAVQHLLTKVNLALGLFDDAIASASRLIDGGQYALMTSRFGSVANDPTKNVIWDLHRPENKDRKSTRLNSSHVKISYAVFCLRSPPIPTLFPYTTLFRSPKGAVQHLLTKVNLALGLFDDAIASASRLIDGGQYALMTSRFGSVANDPTKNVIWDLHRPENKSINANREAILLVMDRQDTEGNSDGMTSMRQAVPFWFNNINTPEGNR